MKLTEEQVLAADLALTKVICDPDLRGVERARRLLEMLLEIVPHGIQWNKYPETKPSPNTHCLVITPTHFPKNCRAVVAEWYEEDGPFYDESSETALDDVTHWANINLPNEKAG